MHRMLLIRILLVAKIPRVALPVLALVFKMYRQGSTACGLTLKLRLRQGRHDHRDTYRFSGCAAPAVRRH